MEGFKVISGVWAALPNIYGWSDVKVGHTLEHLMGRGIDGLFVLGTTGQGADFSVGERQMLLERLCHLGPDPKRVVVAVSANAATDVRELMQHAANAGVRGMAMTPPFYGRFGEEEIERWVKTIFAGQTKSGEMYLYNMPAVGHAVWSLPLVRAVDSLVGVDGIKDSSGETEWLLRYLDWVEGRDASVLVGDERLTTYSALAGGHGAVSGLSTAYPELMVDLVAACRQKDWESAMGLQRRVNHYLEAFRGLTPHGAGQALIAAMVQNGIG